MLKYCQERRTPRWVAEHLTEENLRRVENVHRNSSSFKVSMGSVLELEVLALLPRRSSFCQCCCFFVLQFMPFEWSKLFFKAEGVCVCLFVGPRNTGATCAVHVQWHVLVDVCASYILHTAHTGPEK